MIKISVTTDIGSLTQSIEKRIPAAVRALESAVLSSCEQFVPYRTGELCRSGHATGSGMHGEITWSAAHAHECYYAEREFGKKHHPHATARWLEAARAVSGSDWARTAADALTAVK